MANVLLFLAGYILGIASCAIFAALLLLHRPKSMAPTLRRKYRDAPVHGYQPMHGDLPSPPGAEVGGIAYRFLGTTGEEQ